MFVCARVCVQPRVLFPLCCGCGLPARSDLTSALTFFFVSSLLRALIAPHFLTANIYPSHCEASVSHLLLQRMEEPRHPSEVGDLFQYAVNVSEFAICLFYITRVLESCLNVLLFGFVKSAGAFSFCVQQLVGRGNPSSVPWEGNQSNGRDADREAVGQYQSARQHTVQNIDIN